MNNDGYSFDMPPGIDPRDDGSHSLPAYLGQALQFYGTDKSTPLPSYLSYPLNNQPGQSMFGGGAPLQTPMQQAMAPQTPDTAISQAMAPQRAAPTAISNAMAPAPLTPIQAAFQNQATNPDLAKANALIAAGSALMGGKDLQQGLANAGTAFSNTFDQTLNQQRDLNTPRVAPLGQDGAFSMVQMPGQQPQVVSNDQVQNYVLGKARAQKAFELQNDIAKQTMEQQRAAAKLDQTNSQQAVPVLTNLQSSQAGLNAAQAVTDALKSDSDRSLALKAYSALKPTLQRLAAASGVPAMAQAASDYNTLNNARIDGAKMEVSGLNGSLSNDEWTRAVGAVPHPSDSPEVWDSYYERANPLLTSRVGFYSDVVKRGQEAANRALNPYGPNDRPNLGAPQVPQAVQAHRAPQGSQAAQSSGSGSYQPVTVASFADANRLPSGTVFQAPDGSLRKKP
ncbi:hypothetical protein AWB73_05296 [Caballeronia turbans]|nr:hypothetical protein AWB73_05296 [Caballeronia turbans]